MSLTAKPTLANQNKKTVRVGESAFWGVYIQSLAISFRPHKEEEVDLFSSLERSEQGSEWTNTGGVTRMMD